MTLNHHCWHLLLLFFIDSLSFYYWFFEIFAQYFLTLLVSLSVKFLVVSNLCLQNLLVGPFFSSLANKCCGLVESVLAFWRHQATSSESALVILVLSVSDFGFLVEKGVFSVSITLIIK